MSRKIWTSVVYYDRKIIIYYSMGLILAGIYFRDTYRYAIIWISQIERFTSVFLAFGHSRDQSLIQSRSLFFINLLQGDLHHLLNHLWEEVVRPHLYLQDIYNISGNMDINILDAWPAVAKGRLRQLKSYQTKSLLLQFIFPIEYFFLLKPVGKRYLLF